MGVKIHYKYMKKQNKNKYTYWNAYLFSLENSTYAYVLSETYIWRM